MASKLCSRRLLKAGSLPILQRRLQSTVGATPATPRSPSAGTPKYRNLSSLVIASAIGLSAYALGSFYPPPIVRLLAPRPAPPPLSDPSSDEFKHAAAELETQLQNLPLLKSLRESQDPKEWYETRPYAKMPEERRVNNLTAGALRGPGKLGVIPLALVKWDESESIVFINVGRGMCGHDGIIHGGLLATVLDETLARTVRITQFLSALRSRHASQAINNLPEKVGVTANLSLNYRAPTKADQVHPNFHLDYRLHSNALWQFIVLKTKLIETKGRKAYVFGRVEDLDGKLLVEAT